MDAIRSLLAISGRHLGAPTACARRRLRLTLAVTISAAALMCLVECATALAAWGTGVEASLPANATSNTGAVLRSVSCASAGNCTAVGQYDASSNGDSFQGLLLTETAGAWSAGVEAGLPANAGSLPGVSLPSVSCAAAGNCTAVGSYYDSGFGFHGLLLSEIAGSWSVGIEPTLPANSIAGFVSLRWVSCASVGSCTAVGVYADTSNGDDGLLLTETAGAWTAGVEAALPTNTASPASVNLTSVSCGSAGNCTAVGSYLDSSDALQGLLLTETAGTWSTGVEAPLPANAGSNPNLTLSSVSCVSVGNCTAVGTYRDSSGADQGLLLTQTAGVWSTGVEATLPANAGPGAALSSVSCATAGNCTAVGRYDDSSGLNQGLMLTETAGTWSAGVEATLPANAGPTQNITLRSVSCSSPGNCAAVGPYTDSSNVGEGLLLTQTAGAWSTGVEAPVPANASSTPFASLNSVSCPPTGGCTAVGKYLDNIGPTEQGLIVSSAKASTSLAAAPQIARHGAVGLGVASATLTSGGAGLAGQRITFSDGSLQLCAATTNSKGTATCLIPLWDELFVLLDNRYSATYTATAGYLGSTATTPAVTR